MRKYQQLTKWLSECYDTEVTMSFTEIEDILGFKLPNSAYIHRAWWSNTMTHPQGIAWMEAGYITSDCSALFTKNLVVFSKENEKSK